MSIQKRQYFRIEFPVTERPVLTVGKDKIAVIDASERGLRLMPPNGVSIPPQVKGTLRFSDGTECAVAGNFVRQGADGSIVIQLTVGISLATMMKEQRRLIQKYRAS